MHGLILQDWITLRGAPSASIVQSEAGYLDLGPYQDVVIWLDVREFTSGGATVALVGFETSPTKEDAFFSPNGGGVLAGVPAAVGVWVLPALLNNQSGLRFPLARWLRWEVAADGGGSAWSITFRALVAAHSLSL